MTPQTQALFDTVPKRDPLLLFKQGEVEAKKVAVFLDLSAEDMAVVAKIPKDSVRYDQKMPNEMKLRLTEIAAVCDRVADFFNGDVAKTSLWFQLRNPLLGNLAPKDMIRFGRFDKLMDFINAGLAGKRP